MLESKIKNCTPAEAAYLRRYFSHAASTKIIEENIEDARAEYKKMVDERRSSLQSKIEKINTTSPVPGNLVSESKVVNKEPSKKVDAPVQKNGSSTQTKSVYDTYADYLKNNK